MLGCQLKTEACDVQDQIKPMYRKNPDSCVGKQGWIQDFWIRGFKFTKGGLFFYFCSKVLKTQQDLVRKIGYANCVLPSLNKDITYFLVPIGVLLS